MKFGKDLQQYTSAGWEEDYIDYKGLKLILKQLTDEPPTPREEVDASFFLALEENLEKVNDAFLTRCAELEAALDVTSRGRSVSASVPPSRCESEAHADAPSADEAPRTPPPEPREVIDPAVKMMAEHEARKRHEARHAEFFEAYKTLGRLQTFVWINTKGSAP